MGSHKRSDSSTWARRRIVRLGCCMACILAASAVPTSSPALESADAPGDRGAFPPPTNQSASIEGAGSRIRTYVGVPTPFHLRVVHPAEEVRGEFAWDFDGDGIEDRVSDRNEPVVHVFASPGIRKATFRARDEDGRILAETSVEVLVLEGEGSPERLPPSRGDFEALDRKGRGAEACGSAPGDGTIRRHVVIVGAAGETRFFDDVHYAFYAFRDTLGLPREDIHVLNHDGTFGTAGDPEGILDGPATAARLESVLAEVAATADGDDIVGIWITGHGHGYYGPVPGWPDSPYLGYLDGHASVDPGDEPDSLERDFRLRTFYMGGDFGGNHGMDVWRVYSKYRSPTQVGYWRHRYVSRFSALTIDGAGPLSDGDIYIEELVDYLESDTNRDGIIDAALGEVLDSDGDGTSPYQHGTGTFDEDDWGGIDLLRDDVTYANTQVPVPFAGKYAILDLGLDGRVDIDLDHDPEDPEANGTDLDGLGLIDGLDVNDDGDQDDWVSVDEIIQLYASDMSDDELRRILAPFRAQATYLWLEPCFSGGFIEDLSRADRIVATACEEDTVSYGNRFFRTALSAVSGLTFPEAGGHPLDADSDGDGAVDLAEAFDFTSANGYTIERAQYDDDGDGIPHRGPLPPVGDGRFGGWISVEGPVGDFVRGDANDDGELDISDAVSIALHLFGSLEVRSADALDFDDSGTVDLTDCVLALEFLFRGGATPTCPYPWRGIDLTP